MGRLLERHFPSAKKDMLPHLKRGPPDNITVPQGIIAQRASTSKGGSPNVGSRILHPALWMLLSRIPLQLLSPLLSSSLVSPL
jgi:hypothetical protein